MFNNSQSRKSREGKIEYQLKSHIPKSESVCVSYNNDDDINSKNLMSRVI